MFSFGENIRKSISPGIMMFVPQETNRPTAFKVAVSHANLRDDERREFSKIPLEDQSEELIELSRRYSKILPKSDTLSILLNEHGFADTSHVPAEVDWYEILEKI